jgi:hypothetical protein
VRLGSVWIARADDDGTVVVVCGSELRDPEVDDLLVSSPPDEHPHAAITTTTTGRWHLLIAQLRRRCSAASRVGQLAAREAVWRARQRWLRATAEERARRIELPS